MARYILKRLLLMIPVVLGISLLVFSMMELSPGDPAQIILGMRATPEALENLREEMGLNQPFWTRYFNSVSYTHLPRPARNARRRVQPLFVALLCL